MKTPLRPTSAAFSLATASQGVTRPRFRRWVHSLLSDYRPLRNAGLSLIGATCLMLGTSAKGQSPPIIGPISSPQRVGVTEFTTIQISVVSPNCPAPLLTVSAGSSNQRLVPNDNISVSPSSASNVMNRTLVLLPADIQTGSTVITVKVSDGVASTSTSFTLFVLVSDRFFLNPITIGDFAPASPYPSTIEVPQETPGAVSTVGVTLYGFTHPFPSDVGMLLVAPNGQKVVLMNRAGTGPASNLRLTFSPDATELIPERGPLTTGLWRPADYHTGNYSFVSPAPANVSGSPYTTDLDSLLGLPVKGTWSLYVQDDVPGIAGEIAAGWDLLIEFEPGILGLVDTNLFEAMPAAQTFTIINASLTRPPLTFDKFASDPAVLPIENIRVDPTDSTGTNYIVTLTPQTHGSNVLVAISATDADGKRFYRIFSVGTIYKRPNLSISHYGGQLKIRIDGVPNTKYFMQSTGDLSVWTDAGTVNTGLDGTGEHNVDLTSTPETQFYRLLLW